MAKQTGSNSPAKESLSNWLDIVADAFSSTRPMSELGARLLGQQHFRLHLVCETCFCPQGPGYVIVTPGEWAIKMLPAMQLGLYAANAFNIIGSIGRMFFPALPCIPTDLMDQAKDILENLGKKSTAEEFECIQTRLDKQVSFTVGSVDDESSSDDGGSNASPQVNASLRELHAFLKKVDPNQIWGGLALVDLQDTDADLVWVCPDCLRGSVEDTATGSSSEQKGGTVPMNVHTKLKQRCKDLEQLANKYEGECRDLRQQLQKRPPAAIRSSSQKLSGKASPSLRDDRRLSAAGPPDLADGQSNNNSGKWLSCFSAAQVTPE